MVGEVVEVAALGALEGAEVVGEVGGGVAMGRIYLDSIFINLNRSGYAFFSLIIVNKLI